MMQISETKSTLLISHLLSRKGLMYYYLCLRNEVYPFSQEGRSGLRYWITV